MKFKNKDGIYFDPSWNNGINEKNFDILLELLGGTEFIQLTSNNTLMTGGRESYLIKRKNDIYSIEVVNKGIKYDALFDDLKEAKKYAQFLSLRDCLQQVPSTLKYANNILKRLKR